MHDPDDIKRRRRDQRDRLIAARLAVSAELHRRWSDAIAGLLVPLLAEIAGATIGLYAPFRAEFDPLPLAPTLIAAGRRIALPAIIDRASPLEYRLWQPGTALVPGMLDIPVPQERTIAHPQIVLVPVVGFDAANYRLGYGGGFFDRTLAALEPRPVAIGVGFELSRLATIEPQPHDIALDLVVTEAGIQRRP